MEKELEELVVVVVDKTGPTLSSATVLTKNTESAEQVAIALAITMTRAKYIISDSKAATSANVVLPHSGNR